MSAAERHAPLPTPITGSLVTHATPTYVEQGVQVGEPWAEFLSKEPYNDTLTADRRFDSILLEMKRGEYSIGRFLKRLFVNPNRGELSRSRRHAQAVSAFLGAPSGRGKNYETVRPNEIVELMYSNPDGTPPRNTGGEKSTRDPLLMAHHLLSEWAIGKVEGYVSRSSAEISGKDGGFHLTTEQTSWDFIHGFSLAKAIQPIELKGAVLLCILAAAALPVALQEKLRPSVQTPLPY